MCPIQLGTDLGGRCFYGSREFRAVGGGGEGKPGGPLGRAGTTRWRLVLKPSCWDARR